MAGPRKSAGASKRATHKPAARKKIGSARDPKRRSARRKSASRKTSPKRWSQPVTRESDALDLRQGVFKLTSPKKIAASLKRSAERSSRRKAGAYRSDALDADILYQPCRQDFAENPTRPPTARQDRAETPVSSRLTPSFRDAGETSEPGIRRSQREVPGSRWRARPE